NLYYWSRESAASSAEIDYLIQDDQQLIPVEVKSGSAGKMRSLHQFMHEKPWKTAVRFYAGPATQSHIDTKTTQGYPVCYTLLSLPFYLISQVHACIQENK
ncbi:MAG: AAA family ATPase, partial [Legionella sp.]|nr:AAA family ATPase [Legionella sp.]